ncbi:MAG: O-acetyl-ADP-ribose deacetylase [Firmicutes bacterium]|nr:O-acetyl-ADP-ribose deacetylase [Bacillota bacterium]
MDYKNTEIRLVKGDITKIDDVDAIVNAANTSLLGGGGVDGAIHRAAGKKLLAECRLLGGCKTGEAKRTGAYDLPVKYIIHTVGPVWNGGTRGEAELLGNCYYNSLCAAKRDGVKKIAFPSISTGIYGYPIDEAAEVAIAAVKRFIDENPDVLELVEWVLFDNVTYSIYSQELEAAL